MKIQYTPIVQNTVFANAKITGIKKKEHRVQSAVNIQKTVMVSNTGRASVLVKDSFQNQLFHPKVEQYYTDYYDNFYNKTEEELLAAAKESNRQFQTWFAGEKYFILGDTKTYEYTEAEKAARNEASGLGNGISVDKMREEIKMALSPYFGDWTKALDEISFDGSIAEIKVGVRDLDALYVLDRLEDAAALYAFYVDRAKRTYEGEELASVLAAIDQEFDVAVSIFAKEQKFAAFFEDTEGIGDSLRAYFNGAKEAYTALISEYDFHLSEENQWARNNEYYVTQKLRQYVENGNLDKSWQTEYSSGDINAMSLYYLTAKNTFPTVAGNLATEESLGVELGLLGLQMGLIGDTYRVSDKVRQQMQAAFEKQVSQEIDKMNEEIRLLERNSLLPKAAGYEMDLKYDPVDEKVVWNTIETILNVLNQNDLEQGLRETTSQIADKIYAKAQSQYENGTLQGRYVYPLDRKYPVDIWLDKNSQFNMLLNRLGLPTLSSSKNKYDIRL